MRHRGSTCTECMPPKTRDPAAPGGAGSSSTSDVGDHFTVRARPKPRQASAGCGAVIIYGLACAGVLKREHSRPTG